MAPNWRDPRDTRIDKDAPCRQQALAVQGKPVRPGACRPMQVVQQGQQGQHQVAPPTRRPWVLGCGKQHRATC